MGQTIPEQDSDEILASASTNPIPQQDRAPVSLCDGAENSSSGSNSSVASPGFRPLELIPANAEQEFRKSEPRKTRRADSGKLHRVMHGVLSREALDALVQIGEDRKTLRHLER